MTSIAETIADIASDFALLPDWEERYAHLIELGRALPPLSPQERTDVNKVRGCASQVWLVTERAPGAPARLVFRGDSDAHIVRGLIAVLTQLFSNRTAEEILAIDPKQAFAALGFAEALTPQRSNGVYSMMERMRRDARATQAEV
jgi:cysteine desulfuration protein SufE